MASRERKKKDHQDTGKKRRRMRASVKKRARAGAAAKPQRDEVDGIKFKRGSAADRTRRGAT